MKVFRSVLFIFINSAFVAVFSTDCTNRRSSIIDGKQYRIFTRFRRYREARRACRSWGHQMGSSKAGLADIVSPQIQICLSDMIASRTYHRGVYHLNHFTRGFYTGGTDRNNEGQWRWGSGIAIPLQHQEGFQNWGTYEPNNYLNEDCILMLFIRVGHPRYGGYTAGKWVDVSCRYKRYYICERELPPVSTQAPTQAPPSPTQVILQTEQGTSHKDWGYSPLWDSPQRTPEHWHNRYPLCGGDRQSPVQLDTLRQQECATGEHSAVAVWGGGVGNVKWIIRNTGNTIEIRTEPPRSLYNKLEGSDEKYYIDHMRLIWGGAGLRGSEHQIGNIHFRGELQVYHHPGEGQTERHAFAFMLAEREFLDNNNWSDLLRHISQVQIAGLQEEMRSPPNHVFQLLGDSDSQNSRRGAPYILQAGVRYRGSLPHPPCTEDVIWTVYPRPITLASHQFNVLRHIAGSDGRPISGNMRPLQQQQGESCVVSQ